MNDDLFQKLDKLVAKKKNKKISKQDAKTYESAWLELARKDGYSEKVEKYFFEGMAICGAAPLETYISENENPSETLKMIMGSDRFGNKKYANSVYFRILVHLFALIIKDDSADKELVCPLIRHLPSYSKNNEGNLLGDAPKIMQKYFLDEVSLETKFPNLDSLGMKPAIIAEFRHLMDDVFSMFNSNALSNTEIQAMAAINRWLHPAIEETAPVKEDAERTVEGTAREISEEAAKEKTKADNNAAELAVGKSAVQITETPAETIKVSGKTALGSKFAPEKSASASRVPAIGNLEDVAEQLRVMADVVQKEMEYSRASISQAKKDLEESKQKMMSLQRKLDREEKDRSELYSKNQELTASNTGLISMRSDLERQIKSLKEELAADKQEIAQLIEAKEVLSRDRAKQSEDNIRRLASKLQAEYTDFLDAEDMSMSEDLGENMRLQLRNVFDILIKAGITLK